MSKLILHIGTHKTATTTIQRSFSKNREALHSRGIWYPNYDIIGQGGHYAHLGIVNAFSGQHNSFTRDDAKQFFAEVARRARNYDVTIISAEPFYRHIDSPSGNIPRRRQEYWMRRERYVEQVRSLFPDLNVSVAVVFRRQADYASSLYQEHVKTGNYRGDFETFRSEFWFHFAYLRQAQTWARHFDSVKAMRFEDLVLGKDPMTGFCDHLGLNVSGLRKEPPRNEGLRPDLVVLKRLLHRAGHSKQAALDAVNDISSRLETEILADLANRSLYRGAEERRAFQDAFSQDNARLLSDFFPHLEGDQALYSSEFIRADRPEAEFGDTLSPRFVAALTKLAGSS